MTEEMLSNSNVINIKAQYGTKQQNDMKGIRGIYQLLFEKNTEDRRIVQYKKTLCWCSPCVNRQYDDCVIGSAWTTRDLEVIPKPIFNIEVVENHQELSVANLSVVSQSEENITNNQQESSIIAESLVNVESPIIATPSLPFIWSAQTECEEGSIVNVLRGEDIGKIGTCTSIVGYGRVKLYTIAWSDQSTSTMSRREFYVKTVFLG